MPYIDRDTAIKKAIVACIKVVGHEITHIDVQKIAECVGGIPVADIEEVRHGHWRQNQYCRRIFYCSVCGRHIEDATQRPKEFFPYCHCGTKMDE